MVEFCESIDLTRVNRRVVESLILGGAMDALPGRREQKLAGLDLALSRAQRHFLTPAQDDEAHSEQCGQHAEDHPACRNLVPGHA